MKKSIIIAAGAAFFAVFNLSPANGQILRFPCAGGQCYQPAPIVQNWGHSAPNLARYAVAPCDAAQTIETPAPCEPVETSEPVEACAPVEVVEPCDPVVCDNGAVETSNAVKICVGGTCPIPGAGAVKVATRTAKTAVKTVAASARWLLTVNRTRAAYGLAPLTGSADLDAACGQWLNSPAHRALLLSPNFRAAGVAVVRAQDGRVYCVVKFR